MSGGTFDYMQYRIDDAVEEIERRIARNNLSIKDNWERLDEESRQMLDDYEKFWDADKHPYWVEHMAEKEADKALGLRTGDWSKMSDASKDKWNEIRRDTIKKEIEEHNNSLLGASYSDATIEKIREMLPVIKRAKIYLQRIDWLFAGDDGEDSFLERTDEDLQEAGLVEKPKPKAKKAVKKSDK